MNRHLIQALFSLKIFEVKCQLMFHNKLFHFQWKFRSFSSKGLHYQIVLLAACDQYNQNHLFQQYENVYILNFGMKKSCQLDSALDYLMNHHSIKLQQYVQFKPIYISNIPSCTHNLYNKAQDEYNSSPYSSNSRAKKYCAAAHFISIGQSIPSLLSNTLLDLKNVILLKKFQINWSSFLTSVFSPV